MADFTPPPISIGDQVLYYTDPLNRGNATVGWVCSRAGQFTASLLVFSPDSGFSLRQSVRHVDDPGLLENPQWRDWGAWELSESSKNLRKVEGLSTQVALLAGRKKE